MDSKHPVYFSWHYQHTSQGDSSAERRQEGEGTSDCNQAGYAKEVYINIYVGPGCIPGDEHNMRLMARI